MTWPNHFWLAQNPDFTPLYYAIFSHVGGKALSIFQSNVEVNTNKEWDAMPVVNMTKIR
jgi:hypothetical protein